MAERDLPIGEQALGLGHRNVIGVRGDQSIAGIVAQATQLLLVDGVVHREAARWRRIPSGIDRISAAPRLQRLVWAALRVAKRASAERPVAAAESSRAGAG